MQKYSNSLSLLRRFTCRVWLFVGAAVNYLCTVSSNQPQCHRLWLVPVWCPVVFKPLRLPWSEAVAQAYFTSRLLWLQPKIIAAWDNYNRHIMSFRWRLLCCALYFTSLPFNISAIHCLLYHQCFCILAFHCWSCPLKFIAILIPKRCKIIMTLITLMWWNVADKNDRAAAFQATDGLSYLLVERESSGRKYVPASCFGYFYTS